MQTQTTPQAIAASIHAQFKQAAIALAQPVIQVAKYDDRHTVSPIFKAHIDTCEALDKAWTEVVKVFDKVDLTTRDGHVTLTYYASTNTVYAANHLREGVEASKDTEQVFVRAVVALLTKHFGDCVDINATKSSTYVAVFTLKPEVKIDTSNMRLRYSEMDGFDTDAFALFNSV